MYTPLLIFDGECGFCRIWVEYWKRLTGDRVAYAPFQQVAGQFPEIPPQRFARSVHLALPGGEMLSGAHAVFRALSFAPGRPWLLEMYRRVPGFAATSEWAYGFIAARRPLFFGVTKLLFGPVIAPASYVRVQWLFWKMLGAIYCAAFLSLAVQIAGLIGSKGILPAGAYLSRISEALGSSRYWNFPTVFWVTGSSDLALLLVCVAGAVFSILLMAGALQRIALVVCYVLYLSLTTVGQDFLAFQWDILLLETGFLAIFLGFSPLIVWLFRWLLFRLMLLSGAVKLLSGDAAWRSLAALNFHYYTQPLPTPLAWYMQQLPGWFQEASVVVMFAIELGTAFLIFAPRRVRFFAGFWIVFLQVLILLTGNYTYFNLLTIALCLLLLDDAALRGARTFACRVATHGDARGGQLIPLAVAAVILPIGSGQLLGEFFGIMPAPARFVQRVVAPFYLTNTYGLFAVMTTARHEIIVQGSNDGSQWRDYEFKYKPGAVDRAPRWVAPHQPRLDWQMWFAALGNYRENPWFVNFVFRLLQGSPEVLTLLASDPFSGAPPRYVRALIYDYTFTDFETRRRTGAWWKREPIGTYLPPVSLQDFRQ
jgi:predicted DCC family thiol-disulfide oxidoreductase YuxK